MYRSSRMFSTNQVTTKQSRFHKAKSSSAKGFPTFHATWMFTIMLTRPCHLSLSWARLLQSTPSSYLRCTLISNHLCLDLLVVSFFQVLHQKCVCICVVPHTCHMPHPSHFPRFQHLNEITCRKAWTWDRFFHFPSEGRHVEDLFGHPKNPTASAQFELVYQRPAC